MASEHGSNGKYALGCRCLQCKTAHSRYNVNQRRKAYGMAPLVERVNVSRVDRLMRLAETAARA